VTTPIRIETSQLLDLAGITSDKLRYWKDMLPPIKGRDGRKQGYSFAEAVAIAAIASAMTRFRMDISCFSEHADEFFERVGAAIEQGGAAILTIPPGEEESGQVCLIFRIDKIAATLRDRLTAPLPSSQLRLL
jgi:hypothetical protein